MGDDFFVPQLANSFWVNGAWRCHRAPGTVKVASIWGQLRVSQSLTTHNPFYYECLYVLFAMPQYPTF
jgi:hypothetical protein